MPETTPPTRSTDSQPPGVEALLDRVFISPRIVDQRTFEEFAGGLRTLVRDASAQEKSLRDAGVEVKVLSDQLRDAARELASRVERSSPPDAGPGPDDAALERRVRSVVARVLAAELETQKASLREWIREIARDAQPSVRNQADDPAQTGDPANSGDAGLLRRVEETLSRVREAHAALDSAADSTVIRVAALAEQVQAAAARLEAGKEGLTRLAADVDARSAALRELASALEVSGAEASSRWEDSAREIGVQLAAALGEAERRARLISTGLEAELADAAIRRRAHAGTHTDGAPAHSLDEARRVGEGLARLIAEANIIGPALDRLLREARSRRPLDETQSPEPAV